jgi:hypothetical protein
MERPSRSPLLLFPLLLALALLVRLRHTTTLMEEVPSSLEDQLRSSAPLVAVADLHGDLENAERSLRLAGVLDATGHWSGGQRNLVQTGDVVDRGPHSIDLLRLLWRLREEAETAGGSVTLLLGNHEAWALGGVNTYASKEELTRLGEGNLREGRKRWDALFSLSGELGKRIAASNQAAAVVGDGHCRTLFVHAGATPAFLSSGVAALNERLANALARAAASGVPPDRADSDLFDADGPFWYRGYALDESEARVCETLEAVLRKANASRLVVGHTVQNDGPRTRCGGALVLLDAGICRAYNGRPTAWECEGEGDSSVASVLEEGRGGGCAGRRRLPKPGERREQT